MNPSSRKLILLSLFAVAMAYLESAVVVYLREIYYPAGFTFPLQDIPVFTLLTEIGREAATIVMLWTVAKLSMSGGIKQFAVFAWLFGVWDIFYYVWLKVLLDWPQSLLDWDVLFLIPLPWIAPVLAPVLVSIGLMAAGWLILHGAETGKPVRLTKTDWWIEIGCGLLIIVSFLFQTEALELHQKPEGYPWWLFLTAFVAGLLVFFNRVRQAR